MTEIAQPWKRKRTIGPHVVEVVKSPVTLHDSVNGIHGEYTYQWECKYCGEKNVHTKQFTHIAQDCNGIEWLESELVAFKDDSSA